MIELKTFIEQCKEQGIETVPADDPMFAYANRIGLPHEFIALAWTWFKGAMDGKRKKDWRRHFRNAVEGNWPKYWYAADGGWSLTTAGKQAEIEQQLLAAERQA